MTDKEKRELKDSIISIFKRFNILDNAATIGGLRDDILKYINSLQEEPVIGLGNGNMPIEIWKQAVKAASNQRSYRSSKGLTETRDDYFVDGVQWADEHPKEEPVSEELEEAALLYCPKMSRISEPHGIIPADNKSHYLGDANEDNRKAFKAGAKWKEEQFEKNRLAACDKQTEKEAEIESDFVMSIIENEHRQPTFDDAIKYGMRLQKEQMIKDAIDAEVLENWDGKVIRYDETILDEKLSDCKVFDKVKVIIIKED